MKRRPANPPSEQTISDGQRHVGSVRPNGEVFAAYDAAGKLICKADTIAEARTAVLRNDRSAAS